MVQPDEWPSMIAKNLPDDWTPFRTSIGGAEFVPDAIDRLLHAESPEQATSAYWELDNRVVVQGQLFDSAVPTSLWLVRSVCERDFTPNGLSRSLDLLVELAFGEADQSEVARGNRDLGAQCRAAIRDGLSCIKALVGEADERVLLSVLDLVDRVDVDPVSRSAFFEPLPLPGWSVSLRDRVQEIRRHA